MIAITIWTLLSIASIIKILYFSIQDGQWLDSLLGWQKMLQRMAENGNLWSKPLGHCEMCFSHLVAFMSLPFYLLLMHNFGYLNTLIVGVLMYIGYVPLATILGLYFIKKLFR